MVAVNATLWPENAPLMDWLKLNENELVTGTDTGPAESAALFTFPFVLTQTTPHVISKPLDGIVVDCPVIRTTAKTEVPSTLATIAV